MKPRNKSERILRPVRPNVGLEAAYRAKLTKLVDEMNASLEYWLSAAYRQNAPEIAQDESPAAALRAAIRRLARRWQRRFDVAAQELAAYFATAVARRSDAALRAILKKGGISVEWRMTRAQNDVLQATIAENVSLIKSIPAQYLTNVESLVMQSVQTGRDLGSLAKALQEQHGVTKRRAALISRDQSNKATANLTRARYVELGIKQAVWLHSSAGKTQRRAHVAMNGKTYDIKQGMWDSDEKIFVLPGQLINCFPGDVSLQFAKDVKKAFRHWYCGELAEIVTDTGKTLRATPNHPILTPNGWVPIGLLKEGDNIIQIAEEGIFSVPGELDNDNAITSLAQAFDAMYAVGTAEVALGADFHGDVVGSDVDVVFAARPLSFGVKAGGLESLENILLADSNISAFGLGAQQEFGVRSFHSADGGVGARGQGESLVCAHSGHSEQAGVAAATARNSMLPQNAGDNYALVDGAKRLGDREFTLAGQIGGNDGAIVDVDNSIGGRSTSRSMGNSDTPRSQVSTDAVGVDADYAGDRRKRSALFYKTLRVINNVRIDFSGHVYTLETESGWFGVSPDAIVVKNCRCVARPVVKGFS